MGKNNPCYWRRQQRRALLRTVKAILETNEKLNRVKKTTKQDEKSIPEIPLEKQTDKKLVTWTLIPIDFEKTEVQKQPIKYEESLSVLD